MIRRTILACTLLAATWGGPALSQPAPAVDAAHKHAGAPKAASRAKAGDLAKRVEQLSAQVAKLQAAMAKHQPGGTPAGAAQPMPGGMGAGGMGMGMMPMGKAGKGMGMMDDDMMMMGGMMGMGSGSMASGGMGMKCCPMMGQMPAGGGMSMSALPGFPGASHLYHIGETGFFLDHPQHITLSPEQASTLGKIREDAMRARGESARKVAAAEEQLWQLTAADQPSLTSIESKVRELEKLRGDARLAFIRAVGEAAKVLTDEQQKVLVGELPPAPNPAAGMGSAMPQPGGSTGGGMMMDDDPMEMPPASGGGMGHM